MPRWCGSVQGKQRPKHILSRGRKWQTESFCCCCCNTHDVSTQKLGLLLPLQKIQQEDVSSSCSKKNLLEETKSYAEVNTDVNVCDKCSYSLGPGHTAAGFFDYHRNRPHSATVVKDTVAECGQFLPLQRESIICPKRQIIDSATSCVSVRLGLRDAHCSERVKKQVVQFHLSLLEKETCSD